MPKTETGSAWFFKNISREPIFISFEKNKARLQSTESPNRFVVGAQASLDESGDGLVYLMAVTAVDGFDSSKINPALVAKN